MVVVGSVTIDRIIENRKTSERLGGVATYGGLTFQRLGVETAVVTNIAESDRGLLDVLAAGGLAVHAGTSRLTTRFVNEARGDWREQLMPEAAAPITAAQVKPLLSEVRHIHAGPLHPDDIEPQAMALMAESKNSSASTCRAICAGLKTAGSSPTCRPASRGRCAPPTSSRPTRKS